MWGKGGQEDQEDPRVPPEKVLGLEPNRHLNQIHGLGARQEVQGLGLHRWPEYCQSQHFLPIEGKLEPGHTSNAIGTAKLHGRG